MKLAIKAGFRVPRNFKCIYEMGSRLRTAKAMQIEMELCNQFYHVSKLRSS